MTTGPSPDRLVLQPDHWYGWTMWPGYVGTYYSPIRVREVVPLKTGKAVIDLKFLNLAYAAGVQHMMYRLRILRHEPSYLIAAAGNEDRIVGIELFDRQWMRHHFLDCYDERQFDGDGQPVASELLKLARQAA